MCRKISPGRTILLRTLCRSVKIQTKNKNFQSNSKQCKNSLIFSEITVLPSTNEASRLGKQFFMKTVLTCENVKLFWLRSATLFKSHFHSKNFCFKSFTFCLRPVRDLTTCRLKSLSTCFAFIHSFTICSRDDVFELWVLYF